MVADVVAEDRMARLWPYAAPSLKHAPNWGDIHKNRAFLNDAIVLTKGKLLNFMRFEVQLKKLFDDIAPNTFSVKDITTIATCPPKRITIKWVIMVMIMLIITIIITTIY